MPCECSEPKSRCAMPGTPSMPEPSKFSSAMLSTVLNPHTHLHHPHTGRREGGRAVRGFTRVKDQPASDDCHSEPCLPG